MKVKSYSPQVSPTYELICDLADDLHDAGFTVKSDILWALFTMWGIATCRRGKVNKLIHYWRRGKGIKVNTVSTSQFVVDEALKQFKHWRGFYEAGN